MKNTQPVGLACHQPSRFFTSMSFNLSKFIWHMIKVKTIWNSWLMTICRNIALDRLNGQQDLQIFFVFFIIFEFVFHMNYWGRLVLIETPGVQDMLSLFISHTPTVIRRIRTPKALNCLPSQNGHEKTRTLIFPLFTTVRATHCLLTLMHYVLINRWCNETEREQLAQPCNCYTDHFDGGF